MCICQVFAILWSEPAQVDGTAHPFKVAKLIKMFCKIDVYTKLLYCYKAVACRNFCESQRDFSGRWRSNVEPACKGRCQQRHVDGNAYEKFTVSQRWNVKLGRTSVGQDK